MHTDARELPDGTELVADLCIVGAGAAGIAMAREWIGSSNRRVLLLEGGGFELDPEQQDLYRGEIAGRPYYPLEAARLRRFGGTTGHWGGLCTPLDPHDFARRDWVPHSGWPFGAAELAPYYERAHPVLELGPPTYRLGRWVGRNPRRLPLDLDPARVQTKIWQCSPPTRFGDRYRAELLAAPNVHLCTHAGVRQIAANEGATAVTGLEVACPNGRVHRVRAKAYVLACGAIQNARLLLCSDDRQPGGLGNAHGLVGRYFTEHVELVAGKIAVLKPRPIDLYLYYPGLTKGRGELVLSPELQTERRLLNGSLRLSPDADRPEPASRFERFDDPDAFRRLLDAGADRLRAAGFRTPDSARFRTLRLHARVEQAPNPDSRLTLADERDALGMRRVRLDWRLGELERRTLRAMLLELGRELGRTGYGRVRLEPALRSADPGPNGGWPGHTSAGWHHVGTTRMHADPKRGVVDGHGRVHGIANLYVAGSGTFPTAGTANPTLTIVAMALRLSDHLKAALG